VRDRWLYSNPHSRKVRVVVFPDELVNVTRMMAWTNIGPGDAFTFKAAPSQWIKVLAVGEGSPRRWPILAESFTWNLCEKYLSVVAREFGISEEELHERVKQAERDRGDLSLPRDREGNPLFPGTEVTEPGPSRETAEGGANHLAAASFRILDPRGLHARPSTLIQKALSSVDFEYVEARHEENGRVARITRGRRTKPAYWMLILRLGARWGDVVSFTAAADTREKAEAVLEAISGVLVGPKPMGYAYWRELGLEQWCQIYLTELAGHEVQELKRRYVMFCRSKLDEGHEEVEADSPMAERVRRG
jgi:phosphotransferase system HPr-like phosphotransfer protein